MKAQIKAADRSGAAFAVIVGTNEVDDGVVIVRPLRYPGGTGRRRPRDHSSPISSNDSRKHTS